MHLDPISIKFVEYATPEYELEVELRQKVLRTPLGLELNPEKLKLEGDDIHLGAFQSGRLIGCLILTPQESNILKMRQVAVEEDAQGAGVGTLLVSNSENFAREKGYTEMMLNARESAIPFYRALGYQIYGEPFLEVGIPHRSMSKILV